MKLRNKKTGEIRNIEKILIDNMFTVNSLADLNEDWEDYKEPKEYWYINSDSVIYATDCGKYPDSDLLREEIGNYFETKEEAERAVERLCAWKRLKDKGFKFDGYDVAHNSNGDLCGQLFYNAGDYCIEDVEKDLDLLFGGEE